MDWRPLKVLSEKEVPSIIFLSTGELLKSQKAHTKLFQKVFVTTLFWINWIQIDLCTNFSRLLSSFPLFPTDFLPPSLNGIEITLNVEIGFPQVFYCLLKLRNPFSLIHIWIFKEELLVRIWTCTFLSPRELQKETTSQTVGGFIKTLNLARYRI